MEFSWGDAAWFLGSFALARACIEIFNRASAHKWRK